MASASNWALTSDASWNAGDTRLKVVNNPLDFAGFWSAQVDGWGRVVFAPYEDPRRRAPVWTFEEGPHCIFEPAASIETDAWNVPNVCVLTSSSPTAALSGSYTNDDPASPYSTVTRGREITLAETVDDALDAADLNARAEKRLMLATSATERLEIRHAYAPVTIGDVVDYIDVCWHLFGSAD